MSERGPGTSFGTRGTAAGAARGPGGVRPGEREGRGHQERASYRAPLHPLPAIVFLVVTGIIIWSDFNHGGPIPHTVIPRAMAGVLIAATGFPVYYLWRAGKRA